MNNYERHGDVMGRRHSMITGFDSRCKSIVVSATGMSRRNIGFISAINRIFAYHENI
jgi:hypothetical protein